MLNVLHIENIAVIEQANIEFGRGFNVLTGETGAGKSIVIDAICAIMGERTYRDVIRTGAQTAFVSAIFSDVPELAWFADNQIPYSRDELLVQREISADGKNVCRVNGRPVTVSILRQLGVKLINIHGQHDSQQLFDEQTHLGYLDLFGRHEPLLAEYREAYALMCKTKQELNSLSMDEGEKLRTLESLRFQIDEITAADPKPGEDEALESRRKLLQNAEKLQSGIESALQAIYGGDSSDGAAGLLGEAEHALSRLCSVGDQMQDIHQRVADLTYAAQDIADELRAMRDGFSDGAYELEKLEARLDVLYRLKRKYGASCDAVLAYLEKAQNELSRIEFADERMEQLKKQLSLQESAARKIAQRLHTAREKTADALRRRMESELSQLDMPKVSFSCEFSPCELSQDGADTVRFLMSANVGEAPKPLSKVASGGELARIMLAMKNVMAEQDAVLTLIFDEVDAGVSGRAAQKVAEKLSSVAEKKQVLCVTHLPQIAAMADSHFIVEKKVHDERTFTEVIRLDREQRRRELARITGGTTLTDTMLAGAEELLSAAEKHKTKSH